MPELLDRARWAAAGGLGERAAWGEPLFYLVVASVPCGLAGTAAGWLFVKIRYLIGR